MIPRVILKTHVDGLRPGLFSIILVHCTAPDRGAYPEHVAARAAALLERADLRREAAAKFAVLAAWRFFDFLHENMAWTWRGATLHALLRRLGRLNLSSPLEYYSLTDPERVLYLKYFLEADGALMLALADLIYKNGGMTSRNLYEQFQLLLNQICDEYLRVATDHREKSRMLNRIASIRARSATKPYKRGTLPHKVLPHLQAMVDMGLLTLDMALKDHLYRPALVAGFNIIEPLLAAGRPISQLESTLASGNPFELIGRAFRLRPRPFDTHKDLSNVTRAVYEAYTLLKSPSTGLAAIPSIKDLAACMLLTEEGILASPSAIEQRLDELWHERPGKIRFHVNYAGHRAYVVLSDPA